MSDHRNAFFPDWEPIPWDAEGPEVAEQERGFRERARRPLAWRKVDWNNFPKAGVFGRNRDWFIDNDINYVTTADGEDLILIRNTWSGFPDPPEWGLASRPAGDEQAKWQPWGPFPDLPAAWQFDVAP